MFLKKKMSVSLVFATFISISSLSHAEVSKVAVSNTDVNTETYLDRKAITADSDIIEISNFSRVIAALESCNDTLSRLSLLSNEKVQMTGACSQEDLYRAQLRVRVTIIK